MKLPIKNPSEQYQALYDTKGIVRSSKIMIINTEYVEVLVLPNIANTPELNIINTKKTEPAATVNSTRITCASFINK